MVKNLRDLPSPTKSDELQRCHRNWFLGSLPSFGYCCGIIPKVLSGLKPQVTKLAQL